MLRQQAWSIPIMQRSGFINVDLSSIPFPSLSTDTAGGDSGVYREWSFREVLRLLVDSGIYSGILFCLSRIALPWDQLYLEGYGRGSIFSGDRLHLILTWSRLGPDLVPTWCQTLCVQHGLLSWCGEAPLDGLEILPRDKCGFFQYWSAGVCQTWFSFPSTLRIKFYPRETADACYIFSRW